MTTVINWTPVSERYPPEFAPCYVVSPDGVMSVGCAQWDGKQWLAFDYDTRPIRQDFTHWAEAFGLKAT